MARISKYVMPSAQWSALVKGKRASSMPIARDVGSTASLPVEQTEGGYIINNVPMSDAESDHAKDTVSLAGWKLDTFNANPLLLWCHSYDEPPIGTVLGVAVNGNMLRAQTVRFATEEQNPFGAMVGGLYKAGLCRGFSVGFMPIQYAWNEDRGGVDFLEQELLELSACPVPMNPRVLAGKSAGAFFGGGLIAKAQKAGVSLAPLLERAEKYLDKDREAPSWMHASEAAHIYRSLRPREKGSPPAPKSPLPPPSPIPADVQRAVAEQVLAVFTKSFTNTTGLLPG